MESPGTMLLVRIFRVVSPGGPVVMRLRCDWELSENTARAHISGYPFMNLKLTWNAAGQLRPH
jgi:hypothetical protein